MKKQDRDSRHKSSGVRARADNRLNCSGTLRHRTRMRATAAEFEPIRRKLIAGMSISQIVDEEERDRQAAARKERQAGLGYSTDELAELKSEALDVAVSKLREKPDLCSVLQVLRLLRTVPTRGELANLRNPDLSDQLDAYRLEAATQLGLVAMERNRVYGTELPVPQDELDQRVRKSMEEKNARAAQHRKTPDP